MLDLFTDFRYRSINVNKKYLSNKENQNPLTMSEYGGSVYDTGAGTPYVSLKRTYVILLIVYGLGALFALLAGAALTWHVDPYSECLLFSHPTDASGQNLEYGHEASK